MNPDPSSTKVLVASTPETQQEESVLADETQLSLSLPSPKSMGHPQTRLGVERDEGVEQALGPVSQMDPPPRPSSLASSSALPAQPLQLQSSPPQSTQSEPCPSLSQINEDSNPKSSGISSVSGILDPEQHSLASNISAMSDSQPFRYDKSIDTDAESQETQLQPTQLDSQSTPHTDSTDDEDSSMDTVGDKSMEISQQNSTRDERSQVSSSGMGESSGRKVEDQEEDEQRPKKKTRVSFLPSSHPMEEEGERSNPTAGTPLVRTTSKVLVAETPQRNTPPVSSSPSSSSTGQAGPSGFVDKSKSTPLALATRPSSPLSSAPASATGSALKSHGSSSSDSTVRREPPSIARKEPSLVLGSQGPPSPTQASSSTRPSIPAPHRPSPLFARPTISNGSHQRPPRSPAPRFSSQVPETQPAAAASPPPPSNRFGSTGSTTTIPATASNPSGTSSSRATKNDDEEDELIDELDPVQDEDEEDQQSNFGNSDQELDSGERARQAWMGKQGKSLYGPAEEERAAKQKAKEKAKGKGREKSVEQQQEDDEDEVEDFSNVMDDHDIPTSSMPHQGPRPPTPPRRRPEPDTSPIASPQSSDPLAEAYVSQRTQNTSLPLPFPSTAPQTKNAIAGPSKPASKTHLNIHPKNLGPPVPLQYTPPSLLESQSQDIVVDVPSLSQLDEESQMLPLGLGGGGMEIDNDDEEDDMAESNLPLAMQVPAKRRVSEVEQEDEAEGEKKGVVAEERGGKRSKTSKESKGKGKEKVVEQEEEEEVDTPAKSTRGSDRGRGAARGGRGAKRGASSAAATTSKTPSTTSKSTTAPTTSRNHLARTPARAQAPVDDGMEDSDDDTIEDADDSTWEAVSSKSKKKASTSSEHDRTEDEEDDQEDADEDEEDRASRTHDEMEVDEEPQQEHTDDEPESLAPPPKRSPAKKTPYGSKGKSRGLPPPPPPQLNNGRDKRRRSISDSNAGGSPTPSLPANAEAGPSRRGGLQLPSNASSSRVLAPWGKGKSYYPATVAELTSKDNTYAIEFDDDDTGTAVLSALRRCIFKAGDIFSFDRNHYVVAKDQEDGEALQKGDTIRAYKKGESAKKTKDIPIERVLVQASFVDQFSDRTVVASDLLLRPSTSVRRGTRASTRQPSAIPSSVISSSNSISNSTNIKGRGGKGKGRARASVEGIAFPTGRGSFQGIGFVLTNCSDPDALKKTILQNGGTVGHDIDSFWSVGGVKSAGRMRDQEYESEELKWNEALGEGELKNVLLVADGPSRKPKMMKATALGVPCVSRKWIEIARAEKTVGWLSYLLPKPRSYHNERDEVQTQAILDAWGKDPNVLYDPVNYSEYRERPFDGQKILCLLKTDVERELVTFSSLAMGASSVILETNPDDIDFNSADIFVLPDGEKKLPKILAKNSHKARIVDVEWVYQTVLHGQRRKEQPMKKLLDDLLAKEAEAIAAAAKEAGGGSAKKGKKGGR